MSNSSAPPSASPQTPPTSDVAAQQANDQLNALNDLANNKSVPDLYGLGQWRTQQIDPSGFPPQLTSLLQQAGINTALPMTGQKLAQALSSIRDPGLVAQLQSMLFYAGAYGSTVTSMGDLKIGVMGDKDIKALANTITTAAQTGTPYGTYLATSANYGKANGILGQIAGATSNPVGQAPRADTDPVLKAEAHTLFGHDPSPDEYARFQAFFNQKLLQAAKSKAAAENPTLPSDLPDSYSYGQAIGDLPESNSQFGGMLGNPPPDLQTGQQALLARDGEAGLIGASAYRQRLASDVDALNSANSAASTTDAAGATTYEQAPTMDAAAIQFLQQNNSTDIAQNNITSKYQTLLSILGGKG